MSRLFLRIFLWFWLGSTALFLVLAVSLMIAQPDVITTWRFIGRTAMQYLGSHVADVYEQRGAAAASAVIDDAGREGRFHAWVYTADGRLVAGSQPPVGASDAIARARGDEAGRIASRETSILARSTTSDSGAQYVVVWEGPRPFRWYAQMSPLRFTARLAALVLTGGVVCWLLTWQITRPIGTLRAAARRLAHGDLDVRVGASPGLRRGDELSDLALEFDRMALRIQDLIQSQQQLIADISHELRSPLARLSLALDLARRRLGDEVPEHARMDLEIQRLNGLIGQLLTLARLRGVSGQPPFEWLNLRDLVHEVVDDARFEAEGRGRTVGIDREADVAVLGSRALLRSAVDNVLRNAIRYAPEGSTVSITIEPANGDGRVAVVVRDRGPGVAPSQLTRLFDPFFRVDDARTRESGGIGLGLTIARQAMIAHGGNAAADNHSDGGLVVRLELPANS